jgi:hypothetical protein
MAPYVMEVCDVRVILGQQVNGSGKLLIPSATFRQKLDEQRFKETSELTAPSALDEGVLHKRRESERREATLVASIVAAVSTTRNFLAVVEHE